MRNSQYPYLIFRQQLGMTFIEVLVALVILVTGILGSVALQATAKQGSFDAMQRSLASSLAQDIIERMRTNDSTATASNVLASYAGTGYGTKNLSAPAIRCDAIAALCTSAQRVTNDLYEWEQSLKGSDVKSSSFANVGGLTGAQGCIAIANNAATVAISWQGRTATSDGATNNAIMKCGTSGSKRRQILIQAFIF